MKTDTEYFYIPGVQIPFESFYDMAEYADQHDIKGKCPVCEKEYDYEELTTWGSLIVCLLCEMNMENSELLFCKGCREKKPKGFIRIEKGFWVCQDCADESFTAQKDVKGGDKENG